MNNRIVAVYHATGCQTVWLVHVLSVTAKGFAIRPVSAGAGEPTMFAKGSELQPKQMILVDGCSPDERERWEGIWEDLNGGR